MRILQRGYRISRTVLRRRDDKGMISENPYIPKGKKKEGIQMIATLVLLVLVCGTAVLYLKKKEEPTLEKKRKAEFKIIPTSLCALLALYGALTGGGASAWFLFLGLCVCASADWLLEFEFFKGMAAFGAGHILYIIGYILAGGLKWRSLVVFAVLLCVILLLYTRLKDRLEQAHLYLAYAVILCTMAALASSHQNFLMAGGLLFVVSDCMIGIGMAGFRKGRMYDILIMVTYYGAQFLIAASTIFR